VTRNEGMCAPIAANPECALESEVCTSDVPVTRVVDGVAVTQPCWAWNRTYQCNHISSDNDCSDLEANKSCAFARTECLDETPDGGPCRVESRVYKCPTPDSATTEKPQYICGDDVYCINGDCEPTRASRNSVDASRTIGSQSPLMQ
jgi:conjugal transfer mating pair stabilization protein TraN